jgi:MFS family permease
VAALCALAMMGHGSSVFGVIPLVLVAAFRGLPSWRWVGVWLAVGVALMAPWSAYQKYGDPPGNRLTKWTLAGVPEIDSRSTGEAILDSYREAGVGGTLHNKAENFATISGGRMAPHELKTAIASGKLGEIVRAIRVDFFYYLLPSMGLLLLAPFAMAVGRRRGRRNPAEWAYALTIGVVLWGLLVFGNGIDRTYIHIGTYLLPILGISGAVIGLRAAFPRFAVYYVGLSALLSLAVYAPSLDPPAGSAYSAAAIVVAALALAGFGALALAGDGIPGPAPAGTEVGSEADVAVLS